MRFILSSSELSSRLMTLAKVIKSKNTLPILDSILFVIENGMLHLTASDSETVMKTTIAIDECDSDGSFCVPNRTIIDAVKELPEQPLTFEIDLTNYTVKVIYQNGMYNFTAQNADEFPRTMPITENATTIVMPASVLNDNINRSIFATAQDELRPVMNGIFFDINSEALSIVASDGHKLVRNKNFTVKTETPASFILDKRPASMLKNVLPRETGDVTIKFDERNAEFTYSDGVLTCRLNEGRYPNYNSVIPQNNPNQLNIDRRSLIGALRRVMPFASDSSQLVRFHIEQGRLELSSEDIEFATSAKEDITCEYNGTPMNIGFKGTSLNEILNNLDSDEIIIQLADPSRAGIIVPVTQPENEDVLMLIMPMLLNE